MIRDVIYGFAFVLCLLYGLRGWDFSVWREPVVDLRPVFNGNREDAHAAAEVIKVMAEMIEVDSGQKLKNDKHCESMRYAIRSWFYGGNKISDKYPEFGDTVGAYLTKKLGDDACPLTEDRRKLWVETLQELSYACEYAARY